MENRELKPCPFCGGKAEIVVVQKGVKSLITCTTFWCGFMRESYNNGDTDENAALRLTTAWNKRINDELNKVYCKRYKQNHPEKIKEYAKKYRAEHRDKIIACNKQRYEEHSDEVKERSKNYYHTKVKNNPEAMAKRREYCRKWRENRRANDEIKTDS